MTVKKIFENEPYRFLFAAGIILAIFGLLLWPLFSHNLIGFYPKEAHSQLMYFGFLWAFVAGFLMTAVPKMTQTNKASGFEIFVSLLLLSFQLIFNYQNFLLFAKITYLGQIIFLLFFIIKRFLVHKRIPFEGFLFLPFAFISSFLAFLLFFLQMINHAQFIKITGECFILNLVLGIGSRLIPVLSRFPNSIAPDQPSKISNGSIYFLMGLLFNLTYFGELFFLNPFFILVRFLSLFLFSIYFLGLFKVPSQWSTLAIGLKVSISFILIGTSMCFFIPSTDSLAAQHLVFIGGISLLTLMVASRVMLAHGGVNLQYEFKLGRLLGVTLLLVMSGVARYFAGANAVGFMTMIGVTLFIITILIWLQKFISILQQECISRK